MSLVAIGASVLLALQAESAAAPPMTVRVETAPAAAAAVTEWARELTAALARRTDEFRVVKEKEEAQLVVSLDAVESGAEGPARLVGRFALGDAKRNFTYSFTSLRPDAEKLARNLRAFAEKMKPK
jgi:hypothetical protein